MVESPAPVHPIWRASGPDLAIEETAPATALLRIRAPHENVLMALGARLNLSWPVLPNTVSRAAGVEVAWRAPGEWAIIGWPYRSCLEAVTEPCHDSIWHLDDVTAAWRQWALTGGPSAALLSKDCSLDLHSRVFGSTACARTLLGPVGVMLVAQPGGWRVHADTAWNAHLRRWFLGAGREYGLAAEHLL